MGTKYEKPGTGIPKSDLASSVQTSLATADAAETPAGAQAKVNTHATVIATTGALGHIKVGTNLTINDSGVLSANTTAVIFARTAVTSATYTVTTTDYLLSCNRVGTIAITLPAASTVGRVIAVKDAGGHAGTNTITITPAGADTIDTNANVTITQNFNSLTLIADGTSNWEII